MAFSLTTTELATRLGVTGRTVRAWVAAGMPNQRRASERGGKPACIFDPEQSLAWIAVNVPGGLTKQKALRHIRAVRAAAVHQDAPPAQDAPDDDQDDDEARAPATTVATPAPSRPPAIERPAPQPGPPVQAREHAPPRQEPPPADTVLAMAKNLEVAERLTFGAWANAVRENQQAPRDLPAPHSEVQIAMLMRNWHENVAKRKQLEREMPKIMMERGRYVDVLQVGAVLDRCVAAVCQDLDQVGISVADRCVGKSAREIRDLVDEEVTRARRHIAEVWKTVGRANV